MDKGRPPHSSGGTFFLSISTFPSFNGLSVITVVAFGSETIREDGRSLQGSILGLFSGSKSTAFRFLLEYPLETWFVLTEVASVVADCGLRHEFGVELPLSVLSSSMNGISNGILNGTLWLCVKKT
jgi:hypothetical protein